MNWNSNVQRRCIIAATIAPLVEYRRGYAHSKMGPFHKRCTVDALLRSGDLRRVAKPGLPTVSARAA